MRSFGEQVAIALNNARLYATIEAQATTDGLTGLANHRTFYDRLGQELARASRYGAPLSLLMIDIDDFKSLNDTYGHRAGDEVLRVLGGTLRGELRHGVDLPARYGGEEFAVLLPTTDIGDGNDGGAAALAERLRSLIAATPFVVEGSSEPVHIAVSVGVAAYPDSATNMDELVAKADAALYEAKRAGKDRVHICTT
jgi:diguanylate cyclase (GGDEF)-like protein